MSLMSLPPVSGWDRFFHPAPLGKMNLWRACPHRPVLPWDTAPFFESGVGCRVLVPLIVSSVFLEVQEVPKAVDTEEDSSEEGVSFSVSVSLLHCRKQVGCSPHFLFSL